MTWTPGQSGNPSGRPRGSRTSGRSICLNILDDLLRMTGNQEKIKTALQDTLDRAPLQFFREFIFPFSKGLPVSGPGLGEPAGVRLIFEIGGQPILQGPTDAEFGTVEGAVIDKKTRDIVKLRQRIAHLTTQIGNEPGSIGDAEDPGGDGNGDGSTGDGPPDPGDLSPPTEQKALPPE